MKKLGIIISLFLLSTFRCIADEYIIKSMNGRSIRIGQNYRLCCVDSTFKDDEEILWRSSNVTDIIAQNTRTKKIVSFNRTNKQEEKDDSSLNILETFFDKFFHITHLSTREVGIYDLEETLTQNEFFLFDTIKVQTHEIVENRQYYASYYYDGIRYSIPLSFEEGDIIFERHKFLTDGISLPHRYFLTIYYVEGDFYCEVAKGVFLTVFDTSN